jgi:hypothetical protein
MFVVTCCFYLEDRAAAAANCASFQYFNYGYEAYGCGPYPSQDMVCADLQNECNADCFYAFYPTEWWVGGLDWCWTYPVGEPSEGQYKGDARCTCYRVG